MTDTKKSKKSKPAKPATKGERRVISQTGAQNRTAFKEVLKRHLEAVKWQQNELALATGWKSGLSNGDLKKIYRRIISPAQISGWLTESEASSARVVTRGMVCIVAKALAERYDERDDSRLGAQQLDALLNELLVAAGYSAIPGVEDNAFWERISASFQNEHREVWPPLHVGWFKWGWFTQDDFQGPARQITELVAEMMGVTVKPVLIPHLNDLGRMVSAREIDLVAPMLLVPARMFNVVCSQPLGLTEGAEADLTSGLNFVVHEDHLKELAAEGKHSVNKPEDIDAAKVRVNFVKAGIAEFLRPQLNKKETCAPEGHASIDEAVDFVLSSPKDLNTNAIRIFCADEIICRQQAEANSTKKAQVVFLSPALHFPIVFGVNAHEQRLLSVVNHCIQLLRSNGTIIEEAVDAEYREKLKGLRRDARPNLQNTNQFERKIK